MTAIPTSSVSRKNSFTTEDLLACARGEMFGPGNAQLPAPPMLMMDRIVQIDAAGGAYGKGQIVARCPACKVALYSHYAGAGRLIAFVRAGTLLNPAECPPDIHIFTSTQQPWLTLDDRVPVLPGYYDRKAHWPQASLDRRTALLARAAP